MKNKALVVYLVVLSAVLPLSTDLYLPAFPEISELYHTSEYETNLTLIFFFVFFMISSLVWGPLSDKYGRKPILVIGMLCYTIGGMLCSVAPTIWMLILFRCLQAAGGGCAMTVASAIVKDVYHGKEQQSILAVIQSMMMICPVIAPMLGALLLKIMPWKGLFYVQAGAGFLIVIIAWLVFQESLQEKITTDVLKTIGRLGVVLKTGKFKVYLIIFSLPPAGTMAFVSTSTYIYQNTFGMSTQTYGLFFSITAVGMIIGPLLYIVVKNHLNSFQITAISLVIIFAGGCGVFCFGNWLPIIFALLMFVNVMFIGILRPVGTFLMLNLKQDDTGSASALISASSFLGGTVGMILAPLFSDYIPGIGVICMAVGLISFLLCVLDCRKDEVMRQE